MTERQLIFWSVAGTVTGLVLGTVAVLAEELAKRWRR